MGLFFCYHANYQNLMPITLSSFSYTVHLKCTYTTQIFS